MLESVTHQTGDGGGVVHGGGLLEAPHQVPGPGGEQVEGGHQGLPELGDAEEVEGGGEGAARHRRAQGGRHLGA